MLINSLPSKNDAKALEEIISVPFKIKRKHYLGKGNRMIESPEGGGNLAQLRSREKTKRIVEC